SNKDEVAVAKFKMALSLSELESSVAQEMVRLREIEIANEKLAQEVHRYRTTFLQERVDWISKDAVFTKKDLQDQLMEIEIQELDLKKKLQAKQVNLDYLEKQWLDSRREMEKAAEENPVLVEEIEADHMAWQTQQQEIATLNQELQ